MNGKTSLAYKLVINSTYGKKKPRRVPRKTKKWAKKNGYTIHQMSNGKFYFTRTYRIKE